MGREERCPIGKAARVLGEEQGRGSRIARDTRLMRTAREVGTMEEEEWRPSPPLEEERSLDLESSTPSRSFALGRPATVPSRRMEVHRPPPLATRARGRTMEPDRAPPPSAACSALPPPSASSTRIAMAANTLEDALLAHLPAPRPLAFPFPSMLAVRRQVQHSPLRHPTFLVIPRHFRRTLTHVRGAEVPTLRTSVTPRWASRPHPPPRPRRLIDPPRSSAPPHAPVSRPPTPPLLHLSLHHSLHPPPKPPHQKRSTLLPDPPPSTSSPVPPPPSSTTPTAMEQRIHSPPSSPAQAEASHALISRR